MLFRRSNAARAMAGAASAALPRDACARSRSPRVASAEVAHAVPCVFEMRCFARRWPDNPQRRRRPPRRCDGRIGQRRSVVKHRRGCFEMRAGRRERHNPQRSRARNAACIERGRSNPQGVSGGASRARTEQKLVVRWRGMVEPALYTVEGRQTGDLRQKCGSALIRKAKLPARSCGSRPFWQGWLTRRIERRRHEGGGSCVASW